MSDKELFANVVESVTKRYGLETKNPYPGCGYTEFYKDGHLFGGFNSDGYSLLYNCKQLVDTLNNLIR